MMEVRARELKSDASPVENHQSQDILEATRSDNVGASAVAQSPSQSTESQARGKIIDPSTEDEELFKEDLSAMAEDHGLQVNFEPIICGRKVPLFRLWQVVNSDFGGYDKVLGGGLWPKVARKVNFNEFMHADAAEAIKSAYEAILPKFEEEREPFLADLQEEAMIKAQLRATANRDIDQERHIEEELETHPEEEEQEGQEVLGEEEEGGGGEEDGGGEEGGEEEEGEEEEEEEGEGYDDKFEASASVSGRPQVSSHSKRSLESSHSTDRDGSPMLGSHRKRRRVGKGKGKEVEIASTPEHKLFGNQTPRSKYKPSPLKHHQAVDEEGSDYNDIFESPLKQPNLPPKLLDKRNPAPETRDFNFPPIADISLGTSLSSLPHRRNGQIVITEGRLGEQECSSPSRIDPQKEELMDAFVNEHIALGYPPLIVAQALEHTTMTRENAVKVMKELMTGNGIPENTPGVWTLADDAALDDVEGEDFERVAMKHGTKNVALRQKFLALQRETRMRLGRR